MDTIRSQDDIGANDPYESGAIEAPPAISSQERRMHVRAYNYWVSLLGSRSLPSIEDLNPEDMEDFATNSVLLDFSLGLENPAIIYLGSALREECGIEGTIERADQVPARSLLSRLTDHYLQIIANAAPVGFEAEFTNQRGADIMYRGILMPFSSNDETIDFIYGVISWKEVAAKSLTDGIDEEMKAAMTLSPASHSTAPIWADGPSATADFEDEDDTPLDLSDFGFDDVGSGADAPDMSAADTAPADAGPADPGEAELPAGLAGGEDYALDWEKGKEELDLSAFLDAVQTQPLELKDGEAAGGGGTEADRKPEAPENAQAAQGNGESALDTPPGYASDLLEPDFAVGPEGGDAPARSSDGAGLSAVLDAARSSAAEVSDCDARGRSALYRALGHAYGFSLSAADAPEDYAAMLETAEIVVQERSPMTAIVKLVFGARYDKTRIAEYALALDYARARDLPRGTLADELEAYEGGLKGLVRDMRAARRSGEGTRPARRIERAVKKLGSAAAADVDTLPFDEHGLAVVVARREPDGSVTLVAGIDLADKAAQKVAIAASKLV